MVAEAGPAAEKALYDYGWNLGVAFQMVDDVLDFSAHQARLGKTVGDDFQEGKITLPVILAVARGAAEPEEQAFWKRTLEAVDQRDGDLQHAMALMGRHRALDDAIEPRARPRRRPPRRRWPPCPPDRSATPSPTPPISASTATTEPTSPSAASRAASNSATPPHRCRR